MSSASNTPSDGFSFNDMSQGNGYGDHDRSPTSGNGESRQGQTNGADVDPNAIPKPKRIACVVCRKRKLKCDGTKPSCATCARLGHDCAYDDKRRKSGPKRGYVKALEERLKQVERLLTTQDPATKKLPDAAGINGSTNVKDTQNGAVNHTDIDLNVTNPSVAIAGDRDADRWHFPGDSPQLVLDDLAFTTGNLSMNLGMDMNESNFTWEMIGLGLEEPLPPQETIDELHQIYFDKIHQSVPMIHKFRYMAAMNLAPNQRPPVTLRYAMWTLAASVSEKYMSLREHFYQRSRKYMELDYVKGHGEHIVSIAHAQTHILLANYEFKMMYFPRAWMSTGASSRLVQMLGLHRTDGSGLDVKQCLPPCRDWTESEERRRTFWVAFCNDRYASIGTGWPMTIDEKDITSLLPASEEAFENSRPETTRSLADSVSPSGVSNLSSFGSIVLIGCLFGRNLIHLHRPEPNDRDDDLNGEFWKRHRNMDNILLNISLSLPSHLKLPQGLGSPRIVFANMNIHTSTICLHQAAIFKADKNGLSSTVSAESRVRCITAANEIASMMRMISHMDLSSMNPFLSFCLYVAARVFVQYLKSRPDDCQTTDSLRFMLSAMNALKRKNPLTESFLVQLNVDLESLNAIHPVLGASLARYKQSGGSMLPNVSHLYKKQPFQSEDCAAILLMRDTDANGVARHRKIVDTFAPASLSGNGPAKNGDMNNNGHNNIPVFDDYDVPASWMTGNGDGSEREQRDGGGAGGGGDYNVAAGMQGIIPGQGSGAAFDIGRSYNGHMSGYDNGETTNNNNNDVNMAPSPSDGSGVASSRPTPNSGSPAEMRGGNNNSNNNGGGGGLHPTHGGGGQKRSNSSTATTTTTRSYETSPASTASQRVEMSFAVFGNGHSNNNSNGNNSNGSNNGSNGGMMMLDNGSSFGMPHTPGRSPVFGDSLWDAPGGGGGGGPTGLTPPPPSGGPDGGEFPQMMDMGPIGLWGGTE